MSEKWLLLDFPSIKKFVFGTDRSREIRGGSAILDELNVVALEQTLKEHFPAKALEDMRIYAGGGTALLAFTEDIPEDAIEAWVVHYQKRIYEDSAGGLRLICSAPVTHESHVGATLNRLHRDLASKRYLGAQHPTPRTHTGILRSCSSCATGYAETPAREDPGERICHVCDIKRSKTKQGRAWKDYIDSYQQRELDPGALLPQDIASICKASPTRKGYYALVYGDGDAMGRLVKHISSRVQYKIFSETVNESLREATNAVLRELMPKPDQVECLPADILLLGGDDLVALLRVDLGLKFAIQVAQRFQKISREKLAKKEKEYGECFVYNGEHEQERSDLVSREFEMVRDVGFSISFGVAIAKEKQPFHLVLEQAEALLKSAKRARADRRSAAERAGEFGNRALHEPYIDLADVSQSRFLDLDTLRKEDLGVGSLEEWTCWPRQVSEAAQFHDLIDGLLEANLSKGRMHHFTQAVMKGGGRSQFETLRLLTRLPQRTLRPAMFKFFRELNMNPPPWQSVPGDPQRRRTAVLDLATLHPYLVR